jgi:hypothetical protein
MSGIHGARTTEAMASNATRTFQRSTTRHSGLSLFRHRFITIEKVREQLGSGSPNTINPLLDAWWKRLSARLDAGPAALHRLPESVAHAAEALWMHALGEGRRRAAQEQHATTRALATDKQTLEVRSHVLSLRESELESRLRDREQRQTALEAQLQGAKHPRAAKPTRRRQRGYELMS